MSGNRYFLDTNAIIALLRGELTQNLEESEWVGISVISHIEFLAFQGLSTKDRLLFAEFCSRTETVDLHSGNIALIQSILDFRMKYKLKVPDAIIAASAVQNRAILITEDADFNHIPELFIAHEKH